MEDADARAKTDQFELLIAFGRAAVKAQEIESLLQETLIIVEVARDRRNRSVQTIADELERLTLGQLKQRYLDSAIGKKIEDPLFAKMWKELNDERIFLMHKFFQIFPLATFAGNKKALSRLNHIDRLLDIGRNHLADSLKLTMRMTKMDKPKLRELLAQVVEVRKRMKPPE